MLQIVLLHEQDKIKILEVKDLNSPENILCSFDESIGQTILAPLENHVDESVLVTHFNRINGSVVYDYEHVRILTEVGIDENGFWYLIFNS